MALGAFWHRYRMAGRNPVVGPNAPYGARCFLTQLDNELGEISWGGLNAPYGARCFLTPQRVFARMDEPTGLNAPYGARCFLTYSVWLC